ncbi:MAG TPA: hypothetical protein VE617_15530 [Propionibacteriaceae bacterium]|nr:hypothetical protein [Propionibacteriaceae bacterium]
MILPGTRLVLAVFGGLTLLAFLALFVGAEQTERVFAWTIQPPITAAFLGAAYAGGCALELLALRRGTWAALRIPFLAIGVFTTTTLLVTLLHLDRFHFGSPVPLARFAAWFWLVIYVVVPVAMVVVWVLQERRPAAPTGRVPLPSVLRFALLAQGAVMLAVGMPLLVRPELAAVLWPWTLTPLTARMVAAWLLAFGLAVVLAGREADLGRLEVPAVAYGLLAVLVLVVLARFPESVRWGSPAAWVYLAVAVSILLSSAYGLSRLRREGGRVGRRRLARPDGLS